MGWLYGYDWRKASDVSDHLKKSLTDSGYTILDSASTAYGRRFWALITKPGVEPTIFLGLINGARSDDYDKGAWGYKDVDESMGPCELDCPLRLIDKAGPPPNEWAAGWRDKVRAYHARRTAGAAFLKTAKPGDKVWIEYAAETSNPYTVSYRRKNSLIGYSADGRGPFRLPTKAIIRTEAA